MVSYIPESERFQDTSIQKIYSGYRELIEVINLRLEDTNQWSADHKAELLGVRVTLEAHLRDLDLLIKVHQVIET